MGRLIVLCLVIRMRVGRMVVFGLVRIVGGIIGVRLRSIVNIMGFKILVIVVLYIE